MRFEKWQALGNDYVIVEAADLPAPLTAAGRPGAVRPPHRHRRRRRPAARSRRTSPASSRGCGSSTPTARRPSSAATARARRSCTCATAAGPTATSSRSRPSPARSARRSCRRRPAASTWAARPRSTDFPSGEVDERGEAGGAGRFQHVSIGNPQCAIAVGSARRARRARPGRDRPGDRARAAVPEPHERVVVRASSSRASIRARIFERGVGETTASGTGACGAAVAYVLRGGDSPVTVRLDGGDLEVDVGRGPPRRPDRLGRAGLRGRAVRR